MHRHPWTLASIGVAVGAFALQLLGLPRWVLWLLLAVAAFLVIADVLRWAAGGTGRTDEGDRVPRANGATGDVDTLVRVDYADQTGRPLVVKFDFPAPMPVNRQGEIELVRGHATRVDWVIELANAGPGASKAHITILAPSHLIHHVDPVSRFLEAPVVDFTPENMVTDGTNSIRFRAWFAPLMGSGRTTELKFQTTIGHAYRDIPIRVQIDTEEGPGGLADVYLPIRAVIAPDSKPVRGR